VSFRIENGVLKAEGDMVPKDWKDEARARARNLLGIISYNDDGLNVFDEGAMQAEEAKLEQRIVYFPNGSFQTDSTHLPVLREVFLSVKGLLEQAKIGRKNLLISVYGHSTVGETEKDNLNISIRRAEAVVSGLIQLGLDEQTDFITAVGMGSGQLPAISTDAGLTAVTDSTLVPRYNAVTFDVVIESRTN
jgi:outer membrane protein OmpA-like peptidoglycan-associated protein